jgi:hypothetical protein
MWVGGGRRARECEYVCSYRNVYLYYFDKLANVLTFENIKHISIKLKKYITIYNLLHVTIYGSI